MQRRQSLTNAAHKNQYDVEMAAVASISILVLPAVQIVAGNAGSFPAPLKSLLQLFFAALVFGLVIYLLLYVLKRKGASRWCLAIKVVLWSLIFNSLLQGEVLRTQIFDLWSSTTKDLQPWRIILDIILFVLVIFSALVVSMRNGIRVVRLLGIFSFVVSGLAVVSTVDAFQGEFAKGEFSKLSNFHPTSNTVVIVVDSFPAVTFERIMNDAKNETKFLKDFTYFADTVSAYPRTKYAINQLLAGSLFEQDEPYTTDVQKRLNKSSVPKMVKERGGGVTFAGMHFFRYPEEDASEVVARFEVTKSRFGVHQSTVRLLDAVFVRTAPIFLKSFFYNGGAYRVTRALFSAESRQVSPPRLADWTIVDRLVRESVVDSSNSEEFKFIHLVGAHPPATVDRDFVDLSAPLAGFAAQTEQAIGVLRQVQRVVQRMKELGVYEASRILIVADHGDDSEGEPLWFSLGGDGAFTTTEVTANEMASALPVLLYKESGQRRLATEPKVATTSMALYWVPCLLGFGEFDQCEEFDRAQRGELVDRVHYQYRLIGEGGSGESQFKRYSVVGNSRNPDSWKYVGQVGTRPCPRDEPRWASQSPSSC